MKFLPLLSSIVALAALAVMVANADDPVLSKTSVLPQTARPECLSMGSFARIQPKSSRRTSSSQVLT
ncbi:unnamed protein product [Rhodiola kirilowii]